MYSFDLGIHSLPGRWLTASLAAVTLIASQSCGSSSPTSPAPPPPPPPPACAFQLTPSTDSIGPDGGSFTVSVGTTAQCSWTARVDVTWVTITGGASGTGPGVIALTAAANASESAREVSVTVGDQSARLTQRGRQSCRYTVEPVSQRWGPDGGTGTITITTSDGCAWTATPTDPWVTVSRSSGTGSAQFTYTVAPYTGTEERSARIRIADREVTVRQDPQRRDCEYSVTPVEFNMHWHDTSGQTAVQTAAGCRWTVQSTAGWLTVDGSQDRDGAGAVAFQMSVFTTEATRRTPIEIRWPTPSAGQNVWVTQEGCRYGLDQSPRTIPATGGTGQISAFGDPMSQSCRQGCPWTATSSVDWIRITGGATGAGDGVIFYAVEPNTTGAVRTGVIRVGNLVTPFTQNP